MTITLATCQSELTKRGFTGIITFTASGCRIYSRIVKKTGFDQMIEAIFYYDKLQGNSDACPIKSMFVRVFGERNVSEPVECDSLDNLLDKVDKAIYVGAR